METSSSPVPVLENAVKISKTNLPEEIVMDIISRLPVKRIFQAQCLSKNFSSMATDPHFVNAHIRQSARIRPSIIFNRRNRVYLIRCSRGLESEYTVEEVPLHHNIQFSTSFNRLMIVAACNGLVVLALEDNIGDCFLWNPSTNQCNRLSIPSSIPNIDCVSVSWGFGYCIASRIYKIVRLVYGQNLYHHSNSNCFAEVFSCWTDISWRRLDFNKFIGPACFSNGTTVKGFVYWEAGSQVLAFDLEKEAFSWVSLPVSMCGTPMEFKGSLAVCSWSTIYRNSFDLWVMKDEKRFASDECSWKKICTTIELDSVCCDYYNAWHPDDFPPFIFPTLCLNDHLLLIISNSTMYDESLGETRDFTCYLYDLESKEVKKVPKIFPYSLYSVHNFVESVAPLYLFGSSSSDHDIGHKDDGIGNAEDAENESKAGTKERNRQNKAAAERRNYETEREELRYEKYFITFATEFITKPMYI